MSSASSPDRESAIRLLITVLMERHEQWTTGRRYFDMAAYWQWRDAKLFSVAEGEASQAV